LDETFNGLDAASSLYLKSHLSKSVSAGRFGVILATHSLDVVRNYCDLAHLLVEGQLTKSWGQAELRHFRENPQATFESSIAEAAENPAAVPTAGYTNE
jgi:ABC-type multidrug transport system ATPase subunit